MRLIGSQKICKVKNPEFRIITQVKSKKSLGTVKIG